MPAERYNVVLTGRIANGREESVVRGALCVLMKLPAEKIDKLFANAPVTIKRGLDAASARKYQAALEKTGALCDVTAEGQQPAAPAPSAVAAPAAVPSTVAPAPPGPSTVAPAPPGPEAHASTSAAVEPPAQDERPTVHKRAAGRGWAWITAGFGHFRASPGVWIGVCVIWLAIVIVVNLVPFIGGLAFYFLQAVLLGGLMLGCRAQDEGRALELNHLFMGFNVELGKLVGAGGVYLAATIGVTLLVMILMLVLGGAFVSLDQLGAMVESEHLDPALAASLGVIVPIVAVVFTALILVVLMGFWFAPALIVFHGTEIVEAYKLSFAGCLRNWVPFLVYGIALFGLTLVAMVPLGLGLLVLGPVFTASIYAAYKDIYTDEGWGGVATRR